MPPTARPEAGRLGAQPLFLLIPAPPTPTHQIPCSGHSPLPTPPCTHGAGSPGICSQFPLDPNMTQSWL